MQQRKRFIAGASCPACGVEDRIYVVELDGVPTRCCSRCDFSEGLVDAVVEQTSESAWQPVKLVDPANR